MHGRLKLDELVTRTRDQEQFNDVVEGVEAGKSAGGVMVL